MRLRLRSRLRRAGSRPDGGYALPGVIGIGLVMLILIAGSLSVTSTGLVKADNDQDWNAALAAAYGGAAEYQSRLSNDSTYQKYGNPGAAFTKTPLSTVTLPTGAVANPAFDIATGGTWATIPGSDGRATYRYEVNNSQYSLSGILKLRVTGKVGNATRSIVVDLKQTGFLDFLYFTDFETLDPDIVGASSDCERYAWATPARPSGCTEIQFGAADVIDGPVHSNDTLVICSSTFKRAVTSASTLPYENACASTPPKFSVGTGVTYRSAIDIPPTNADMKKEARNDLSADVPRPGCIYTGPTSITMNSNGTMTIVSPWTLFTNVAAIKANSTNPAQCGSIADLHSAAGATVAALDKNLIYVQNVPKDTADANYSLTSPTSAFTCTGSGATQGWSIGTIRYPMTGESTPATSSALYPAYGCENGDLFVKGVFNGEMTLAAENYVYVTGDLTYDDPASSILGIVGQSAVWIWNPMKFTYSNGNISGSTALLPATGGRTVHAAILSVAHTFMVQNYQYGGKRGDLTVLGAIAQKFRGTVATTNSGAIVNGYSKKYIYDDRLRVTAPPKFLSPVSTTYGVSQYATVPAAFTAAGTPVP